ncbi:MAG: PAS domain S-box protein [Spirochaetes bacterium]|nr:PAS domain S-box protein [Spirochaetota bacterium]
MAEKKKTKNKGESKKIRELERQVKELKEKLSTSKSNIKNIIEKNSLEKYHFLLQNAPLGIILIDTKGNILDVNSALLEILGSPSEEETKKINLFTFPLLVKAGVSTDLKNCIKRKKKGIAEHEYISKWGKRSYLRYHLTPVFGKKKIAGVLAVVEDISKQKNLQEQLVQSEKYAAVGQLASGVAHEFNNLLSIIRGHAQLSFDENSQSEIKKSLKVIDETTTYAGRIVKNLAVFARQKEPRMETGDITKVIDQVIDLQKEVIEVEGIKVKKEYIHPSPILFDREQIQQVVFNLLLNAIQAVILKGKGRILITVQDINDKVQISVKDTGVGIEEKYQSKIFDPFFTTKGSVVKDEQGLRGTGLGLSVTHTIIQSHKGTITVKSKEGKGTTVIVTLPRATSVP